jgi:hypothetical protein
MPRLSFIPLFILLAACPSEKPKVAKVPVDTASADLSKVQTSLPPMAPDTFKPPKLPTVAASGASSAGYPEAPAPLLEAVQREEAFSRFCFTEFGKKADPALRGNVAMLVTVVDSGLGDARVGASNWSSTSGNAVNRCLNDKAKRAWKLAPGKVKPGKYAVRLSFTGT